jgi:hypothetical protein
MNKDVLDYFDDKTAGQIAWDLSLAIDQFRIVDDFKKVGKIDFSFDVQKGKTIDAGPNTYLLFDLPEDSVAYAFLKASFDREISVEEEEKLQAFTEKVCQILSEKHGSIISGVMRKVAFNNISAEAIPMEAVRVYGIEMVDYSSVDDQDRYTLRIAKLPDVPVNTQAVLSFIQQVRDTDKTKTSAQVVEEERAKGNKLFEGVLSIQAGHKYLWDVSMSIYIDYSYSEGFVKAQQERQKKMMKALGKKRETPI